MDDSSCSKEVNPPEHHKQQTLCTTRPPYRQGRKLTAVKLNKRPNRKALRTDSFFKVYTVNDESQHLIIYGVPVLKLIQELTAKVTRFGQIKLIEKVTQYKDACEEFTESYHITYERIQSARIAKRMLDDQSFYGGVLHVCYAPEYETIDELRAKLEQRRRDVAMRLDPNWDTNRHQHKISVINRKRKYPALPIDESRLESVPDNVWAGIPQHIDPRLENEEPLCKKHYLQPKRKIDKAVPVYGPGVMDLPSTSKVLTDQKSEKMAIKKQIAEKVKRIVFKNAQNKTLIN